MPGALKLTKLKLSIFHSHKPYCNKLLQNLSPPPPHATAPRSANSILRLNSSAFRWPMTTLCAPSVQPKIAIGGLKSRSFASTGANKGQNRSVSPKFDTGMRAAADCKAESESEVNPPQKLLTLPTILTIGRVASVPLLVGTFYAESWWGPTATTGIFVAAAITDWLDGYLARKMKLGTQFGAFLDPVADKLMVAATLILLCTKPFEAGVFGQASWLLTVPAIAIIGREITMSAVREWAASQDKKLLEAVAVNNLGKWKTASQMSALTILLASRDSSLVGAGTFVSTGVVLLYISAWLALWSLVVYMRKIWKVLLRL